MPERIPSFGFARGAVVRAVGGGPNMIVVRGLGETTAVILCEGDAGGTLRLREFRTSDLEQHMPSHQHEPMAAQIVSIAAAAIQHSTGIYQLPRPYRHHHIIGVMHHLGFCPDQVHDQGFVTTAGRFVGRDIAWKIAKVANQLLSRAPTGGEGTLFSEDLW